MRATNHQITLKPQDLVVLLKLSEGKDFTYSSLARQLFMSSSEVHSSLQRAKLARLASSTDEGAIQVAKSALREFMLHGARYAFPPISGTLVRGMPTAYAAPPLREQLVLSDEPVPVWPYSKGSTRGVALQPLYPSVPRAAERDSRLYDLLSLFDAIRVGAARERELAMTALNKLVI